MKVTIIGLGLIGGSLAKDLRRTKFATELIGVEPAKSMPVKQLNWVWLTGLSLLKKE
jgi:prephenate dehydrogenase